MTDMMSYYTVVLLYPDWAAYQYGEDVYLAFVEARTYVGAVDAAQDEALAYWMSAHEITWEVLDQGYPPEPASDFVALAVFEGNCKPVFPETWE